MLIAAFLLAQLFPVNPEQTPLPSPSPSASPAAGAPAKVSHFDFEAGGGISWLNHDRGDWHSAYSVVSYRAASGFKIYTSADNSVRFGSSQSVYGIGMDVPTHVPHGTLKVGYVFSPMSDVLPTHAWLVGYDLRSGGGYGYQFGYVGRSFASTSAANYSVGFDRYKGDQRFGYILSFATEAKASGTGVSQSFQWAKFLPADTIVTTVGAGRGVESTGRNKVAAHDVIGFDVDELHWFTRSLALRLNAGYQSVYPQYQRIGMLAGLKVRF